MEAKILPDTTVPTLDTASRYASLAVDDLVSQLEPGLDPHQRSLLHQLRLAAETLGAVRATSQLADLGRPSLLA